MRTIHTRSGLALTHQSTLLLICALVFFLLAPGLAVAQETPSPASLSSSVAEKIHNGEVHVELEQGSINRGVVIGIIQHQVNDVIPLVARCWEYGDWRDSLTDTKLKARPEDDVVVCSGTAKVPWPARNRHGNFRVHNHVTEVEGTQSFVSSFQYIEDSGNMDDMFGYWILQPYGDDGEHTILKHVLNVDIGGWLPDALVRWATRRTLPDTVLGIREQLNDTGLSGPAYWKSHSYD